jgi:hypothetical protein
MSDTRVITLLFVVALLAPAGVAPAVAQSDSTPTSTATNETADSGSQNETVPTPTATPDPTSTPTATATATPTPTPEAADDNESYVISIGEHGTARVVEQEWDDGTLTMVVEVDRSQTITVTDASLNLQNYEAKQIRQENRRVPPGRTEFVFAVEKPNKAAVTVGSSRGGLVGLSPGDGAGMFSRAASWGDVRVAAVFALFAIPSMGFGIWWTVAARSVDVELVDPEGDDDS